ncbi:MAG: MFS transporter [Rhizomicrobium sp.]
MRISFPSGALWQHAGFMRLWAAQTVSSFGARITREGFAMTAILSIDARPAQLGLLAALTLAPQVVVGLFAGGFVDRASRRRIMIGADLLRAALLLTIPAAAWLHLLRIEQLYVCAFGVGAASALFDIADHAFLPTLIGRNLLVDGNTKLSATEAVAEIGGPALAGALFEIFTAPFAMLCTSLTYFVSALFLLTVPHPEEPERIREGKNWLVDLREGWDAIMAEPLVRPVFWIGAFSPLFGAFFSALYMIYALKVLGLAPALLGLCIAMGGVGALFGAGLSSFLCRCLGVGPTIVLCGLASGALALLIPLASGPLWLKTAIMMLTQFGGDAVGVAAVIPVTSLRQSVLPQATLGRTAALFSAAAGATSIVGALVGGALGGLIDIRQTLFIAALACLLTPLWAVFSPLRRLKKIP